LPLENVLEAIADYDISICINWARSAIEGQNSRLPLTHVHQAKRAGKLGALMFSARRRAESTVSGKISMLHSHLSARKA
jgi:hypothetical protein